MYFLIFLMYILILIVNKCNEYNKCKRQIVHTEFFLDMVNSLLHGE